MLVTILTIIGQEIMAYHGQLPMLEMTKPLTVVELLLSEMEP